MIDQPELTDEQWILQKIAKTQLVETLENLAEDIKYDTWEKVAYTQGQEAMNRIRAAWARRIAELKDGEAKEEKTGQENRSVRLP